jgi:hypothetical protein
MPLVPHRYARAPVTAARSASHTDRPGRAAGRLLVRIWPRQPSRSSRTRAEASTPGQPRHPRRGDSGSGRSPHRLQLVEA